MSTDTEHVAVDIETTGQAGQPDEHATFEAARADIERAAQAEAMAPVWHPARIGEHPPRHRPTTRLNTAWERELELMTGASERPPDPAPGRAFWIVVRLGGSTPTRPHPSEAVALAAAGRLATAHPGQKFHVMKLVATAAVGGEVRVSRPVDVSEGL